MRTVATIAHPQYHITIFVWNEKYILKIEQGMLEQTYKLREWDVTSEEDVKKLLDEEFLNSVLKRFEDMNIAISEAIERL